MHKYLVRVETEYDRVTEPGVAKYLVFAKTPAQAITQVARRYYDESKLSLEEEYSVEVDRVG